MPLRSSQSKRRIGHHHFHDRFSGTCKKKPAPTGGAADRVDGFSCALRRGGVRLLEAEREQLLCDLILFEVAPLVRNTLRQRLGFYVSQLGANPQNHDAEDLYHDVMAKLIALLSDPQLRAGWLEIQNFRRYVLRVAANACHDYLRVKTISKPR